MGPGELQLRSCTGYKAHTDAATADALYAEGYAREHLRDLRLTTACYELVVLLTGHPKAQRRLTAMASDAR